MKKKFYTELAYIVGLLLLAFGTAILERAEFGMSMVIAPAYILHLKVSQFLPFFSFGMACYTFEVVLLLVLIVIGRRAKLSYLFSFGTAILYGFTLDGAVWLAQFLPCEGLVVRIVFFVVGILISSWGLAFLFRTYVPQEAFEIFVLEMTELTGAGFVKVKIIYDICSLMLAVAMSFLFFGFGVFNGVNIGTLAIACVNGVTIGMFGRLNDKMFSFVDGSPTVKAFLTK